VGGPGIGACCYEIGEKVARKFELATAGRMISFIRAIEVDRPYAVTDAQIDAQVPFEALPPGQTSGSVNVIVQRNGQNSAVQFFQAYVNESGVPLSEL
jgi:hypothetical protein